MSQIEHNFRQFLSKKPEIEKCYIAGLINRRSLARHLINEGIAKKSQLEAVIAMLRRFEFNKDNKNIKEAFSNIRVNLKDNILIMDFDKDKEILKKLQRTVPLINYDNGDTLKIVLSTSSIRLFIDAKNEAKVKEVLGDFKLKKKYKNISEISMIFSDDAIKQKGIMSTIAREFALNDIVITECLTATPEMIIYLDEKYVLKAYEIIKGLQKG